MCDCLESHARRIYSSITTPQLRAAREAANRILKRHVGKDGWFGVRDVYLKGWSGLDTPESVKSAVEILEDAGWIVQEQEKGGPRGGRPSVKFLVNPLVFRSAKNGQE
jgi:hypothetical protein